MTVDTAGPDPDGVAGERIRYYLVNELLYAFYASPTGAGLVGLENPRPIPAGRRRTGRDHMSSQPGDDVDRTPAEHADVCIVGAGPSGALIAAELSAAGHDVVVLDAGPRFDPADREGEMENHLRPGNPELLWGWAASGTPTARRATATTR